MTIALIPYPPAEILQADLVGPSCDTPDLPQEEQTFQEVFVHCGQKTTPASQHACEEFVAVAMQPEKTLFAWDLSPEGVAKLHVDTESCFPRWIQTQLQAAYFASPSPVYTEEDIKIDCWSSAKAGVSEPLDDPSSEYYEENAELPPQVTFLPFSRSVGAAQRVEAPAILQGSVDARLLFEKMVGTMLILHHSGMSETTFFLDTPQFASSLFFGSQITIREYSSAPKVYNISFSTSAPAATLLHTHIPQLMTSLEQGNFPFTVHRLETGIDRAERPLFHRKQATSNQEEQEGGQ
jgi:hypothetical protein